MRFAKSSINLNNVWRELLVVTCDEPTQFDLPDIKQQAQPGLVTIYHTEGYIYREIVTDDPYYIYWFVLTGQETITTEDAEAREAVSKLDKQINPDPIDPATLPLDALRTYKHDEVSAASRAAIVAGVDVTVTGGATEHFALAETDQINLTAAAAACEAGAPAYPYHADGALCKLYPAADIAAIGAAATAHKLYHTTYCNHLFAWIARAEGTEELLGITYGAQLPDDLAANMEQIMQAAQTTMEV